MSRAPRFTPPVHAPRGGSRGDNTLPLEFAVHMDVKEAGGADYRTVRLLVDVTAWGRTKADAERAVFKAAVGPARAGWNFADVQLIHDGPCPFDPSNPEPTGLLAADAGDGWAYEARKHAEEL